MKIERKYMAHYLNAAFGDDTEPMCAWARILRSTRPN